MQACLACAKFGGNRNGDGVRSASCTNEKTHSPVSKLTGGVERAGVQTVHQRNRPVGVTSRCNRRFVELIASGARRSGFTTAGELSSGNSKVDELGNG